MPAKLGARARDLRHGLLFANRIEGGIVTLVYTAGRRQMVYHIIVSFGRERQYEFKFPTPNLLLGLPKKRAAGLTRSSPISNANPAIRWARF
jgi:hypothetical protein